VEVSRTRAGPACERHQESYPWCAPIVPERDELAESADIRERQTQPTTAEPTRPFEHQGGSKAVAARNVLVVESDHDAAPVDRTVTTRIGGGPPLLSSDTIGHGCLDEGRDDRARVARTTDARLNRSCRRGDPFRRERRVIDGEHAIANLAKQSGPLRPV
jgi:hypothetical protein